LDRIWQEGEEEDPSKNEMMTPLAKEKCGVISAWIFSHNEKLNNVLDILYQIIH